MGSYDRGINGAQVVSGEYAPDGFGFMVRPKSQGTEEILA